MTDIGTTAIRADMDEFGIIRMEDAYALCDALDAAQARIANALAIDDDGELTRGDRIKAMRRALTGETP